MMKLPKIEKKHGIAAAALTAVAAAAFFFGTTRGSHAPAKPADTHAETKSDGHGEKHTDPHSKEDSHERKPASAPAEDSGDDHERLEEEEVDVQIAHHAAHPTVPEAKADHRGPVAKLFGRYADAWTSVQEKVQAIQSIEEENKKLKLENAFLRVTAETQKFECREEVAKKKTETVGHKLATTAGSKAARSIASIRYQFPENLLPEQLHALGVSYFKVKDDEKAAVILNFLTELEDDKSFRTPANYLMAGISFFRLEHYTNAGEYFEKASATAATDEPSVKAKRQASYWKALVAERLKDRRTAQNLILENLEKDPHTQEARWVNPRGTNLPARMPASTHESHGKSATKHETAPAHH